MIISASVYLVVFTALTVLGVGYTPEGAPGRKAGAVLAVLALMASVGILLALL